MTPVSFCRHERKERWSSLVYEGFLTALNSLKKIPLLQRKLNLDVKSNAEITSQKQAVLCQLIDKAPNAFRAHKKVAG